MRALQLSAGLWTVMPASLGILGTQQLLGHSKPPPPPSAAGQASSLMGKLHPCNRAKPFCLADPQTTHRCGRFTSYLPSWWGLSEDGLLGGRVTTTEDEAVSGARAPDCPLFLSLRYMYRNILLPLTGADRSQPLNTSLSVCLSVSNPSLTPPISSWDEISLSTLG